MLPEYRLDPPEPDYDGPAYCPACGETDAEATDHDEVRCTMCGMCCEMSDEDALEAARALCDARPDAALELLRRLNHWHREGAMVTEAIALHGLRPRLQGEAQLLDGLIELARRVVIVAGERP